ncbi:MAG: complex I NDUFA9 subunit family protein [Amylibacter sp.]|jgi:NADH dehydrogenase|tara:strand:- start:621 stop:1613 length:993 start_codon:yes stop_codon:yes gene_type:complete
MSATPKLVTIFGGSGFVGRYIVRRMAKEGWRVRVAVRRPNEAIFVKTYGDVGQIEPLLANIRDEASTRAAIIGSDAVVNCVGILNETSRQKFNTVQTEGAGRIARIAAECGVTNFVHFSAIGADSNSESNYSKSKAEGESLVRAAFKSAIILRPSIVFGNEDQFFNRFATMAKLSPIVPLVGSETKFQPVYVDDLAAAAVKAITENVKPGIYELGGPEVATFKELIVKLMGIIRRKRLIVNVPFFAALIQAYAFDMAQKLSLGLFTNSILTRDQVRSLKSDNVVSSRGKGFKELNIEPIAMDAILEEYLYRHRPYGQYTELTETAGNLKP